MGCDIHMHVEFKRDKYYSDKKGWMCGDYFHISDPTNPYDKRADELRIMYDFEFERPLTEDVLKKMENIRIVFWFDN